MSKNDGKKNVVLNPKQELTLEYYKNPSSETFGNLKRSMMRAGFGEQYSSKIVKSRKAWLTDNIKQDVKTIKDSENNLRRLASYKINFDHLDKFSIDLLKLQTDVSKFIVDRLAGEKYNKSDIKDKGVSFNIQINNYDDDKVATSDIDIKDDDIKEVEVE